MNKRESEMVIRVIIRYYGWNFRVIGVRGRPEIKTFTEWWRDQ